MYLLLEDLRARNVRLPRQQSDIRGNFAIA